MYLVQVNHNACAVLLHHLQDDDDDDDFYDDLNVVNGEDGHLGHSHSRIGEEGTKGKAGEHCDCRCYVLHMGKVFFDWYKM